MRPGSSRPRRARSSSQAASDLGGVDYVRTLESVIEAISSSIELDAVLQRIVDLAASATACPAGFLYLFDEATGRLILRAVSPAYQQHLGRITLHLGEGVTGWAALHRQPVILRQNALADPRFRYFPELREEEFQSMLSVPVTSRSDRVLGVINLHTVAPHTFSNAHLRLLETVASLVAGAIENAQLYEATRRRADALARLSELSYSITAAEPSERMLGALATSAAEVLRADLGAFLVLGDGGELQLLASSDPAPAAAAQQALLQAGREALAALPAGGGTRLLNIPSASPPAPAPFLSALAAPLDAAGTRLGLLLCASAHYRRFGEDESALMVTLANQAAVSLQNARLVEQLTERHRVRDFLDALAAGVMVESAPAIHSRGAALGCDLTKTHLVLMVEGAHLAPALRPMARVMRTATTPASWTGHGRRARSPSAVFCSTTPVLSSSSAITSSAVSCEFGAADTRPGRRL